MPKLLFFSRVALICNGCFLVAFLMKYITFMPNGILPSTVIILGYVVAIVLNSMLNLLYGLLFLAGKLFSVHVPAWLVLINFAFFIFQTILLIK